MKHHNRSVGNRLEAWLMRDKDDAFFFFTPKSRLSACAEALNAAFDAGIVQTKRSATQAAMAISIGKIRKNNVKVQVNSRPKTFAADQISTMFAASFSH